MHRFAPIKNVVRYIDLRRPIQCPAQPAQIKDKKGNNIIVLNILIVKIKKYAFTTIDIQYFKLLQH